MHILLLTATGAENLGDELITLYELKQLSEPNTKITVLTHDAARTQRFFISQKYPTERINIAEYFPKNIRKKIWKNIALFWKNLVLFASADAIYIG